LRKLPKITQGTACDAVVGFFVKVSPSSWARRAICTVNTGSTVRGALQTCLSDSFCVSPRDAALKAGIIY
jgi:hypothetical protein